jgi:hypothetical protein
LLAAFLLLAVGAGVGSSARGTTAPRPPGSSAAKPPATVLPATPIAAPKPGTKRPVPKPGHLKAQKALAKAASLSAITNPGFETGDLTGWTVGGNPNPVNDDPPDGPPFVTTSYTGVGNENVPPPQTFTPPSGSYFAVVYGGCPDTTLTSQDFTASAGDTISGWVFFQANDYLPFDDHGGVQIVDGEGAQVAVLYDKSVNDFGDYGGSPTWFHWSYTFTADGTYGVQAFSVNVQDCALSSAVGIDMPEGELAPPPPVPTLETPANGSTVDPSPTLPGTPRTARRATTSRQSARATPATSPTRRRRRSRARRSTPTSATAPTAGASPRSVRAAARATTRPHSGSPSARRWRRR